MLNESNAERAFMNLWSNFNMLPIEDAHSQPVREYQFDPTRKWRLDFCWPLVKVAVECEGGSWTGGRHTRGVGFQADCEKYNRAVELGWRVLRFTPTMLENDPVSIIRQIEKVITG